MIVKIEKVDHQGRGIAFLDRPIFISNCLLNEIVDIDIVKETRQYMIGKVNRIINKSIKRINPKCPYYELCGGCNLMHMQYEDQLIYKQNKINDIVSKYIKENIIIKKIIPSDQYNYRNKATFQVNEKVGYYQDKTYEIVNIDNCIIVDKKINLILKELDKINLNNVYQIVIRIANNQSMIIFKYNHSIDIDINLLDVNSIIGFDGNSYHTIKGQSYIIESINDFHFIISPDSFFQVNKEQMVNLYNKIIEYGNFTKKDEVLDLYCGTGTIGIWISSKVKKVFGIEINQYAIYDALKNKQLNKIDNIDFICDTTSNIINSSKYYDKVVVDPPRSGLDHKTIKYLLKMLPKRIIYVSCDPITMARDLNFLKEKYSIDEITPLDMFPNTYHVESICLLKNKED